MMRGVQTMICAVLAWLASAFRHLVASVLRSRPVPKHIAFIMDGNRRYAENQRLQAVQGHTFGYNRLIDALQWCLDLGVQAVSVYAFSIDNYQRSPEEVATLMQLAEDKLAHMLEVRRASPAAAACVCRCIFAWPLSARAPPFTMCRRRSSCGSTECRCG